MVYKLSLIISRGRAVSQVAMHFGPTGEDQLGANQKKEEP